MDWLTETSAVPEVAPLLLWIKIVEMCAVVLFALALITLVIGRMRHLSQWVRLTALVPLAAAIGAAIVVHVLHDSYIFWVNYSNAYIFGKSPPTVEFYYYPGTANTDHTAAVVGWVVLIVTALCLIFCLVGAWRRVQPEQRRQLAPPPVKP
jgi:hypothetical protein